MVILRAKTRLLCLLFAFVLTLTSCSNKDVRDYREYGFCARVIHVNGGTEAEADIFVEAPSAEGERKMRIELTYPESLSGIVLCCDGGERYILCGEMRLEDTGFEYLFEWFNILLPTGELKVTGKCELSGTYALGALTDECEIYLDISTHSPKEIRKGDKSIKFKSFSEDI